MMTLSELRELEPELLGATDAELTHIRSAIYELAELALEAGSTSGSKDPVGFVPKESEMITIPPCQPNKGGEE